MPLLFAAANSRWAPHSSSNVFRRMRELVDFRAEGPKLVLRLAAEEVLPALQQADVKYDRCLGAPQLQIERAFQACDAVRDHDRKIMNSFGGEVDDGQVLLREVVVLPDVTAGERQVAAGQDRGEQAGVGSGGRDEMRAASAP